MQLISMIILIFAPKKRQRLRLNPCLMYYAGISDEAQLPNVDNAKAFSDYLLSHGMNQQQLDALIQALR